MSDFY